MSNELSRTEEDLFRRVEEIVESARRQVVRTVNTAMVHAYWLIGREIVEVEQEGQSRAGYGEQVVRRLADRLSSSFGKGFSYPSIKRMKQFYLTFTNGSAIPAEMFSGQKGSALLSESPRRKGSAALSQLEEASSRPFPPFLGWTHYLVLMRVANPAARAFYEIEAVREAWSTRQLERQIGSLLFERLAKSRDKEQALALASAGHDVTLPIDVIKDPFVLEFLNLPERHTWLERDLEQAIIEHIEDFLLEPMPFT